MLADPAELMHRRKAAQHGEIADRDMAASVALLAKIVSLPT
ncbi:MAG: hypothetical protein WDN69_33155 [Aliidongia sp.]